MEDRHLKSAVAILKKVHYITIATVCPDGTPWNTPVSASFDENLTFFWGSHPEHVHSQNIRITNQVFVVVFDSTAPEGTGEAVYMSGKAEELAEVSGANQKYSFMPTKAWINDEIKNTDGSYLYDIRVELNLDALKKALTQNI